MNIYNVKLYDFLKRSRYYKENREYYKVLDTVSEIDSIMEYPVFKEKIQYALKSKYQLMNHRYSPSSYHYGYYSAFVNYAGIDKTKHLIPTFSNIEHGMGNIDSILDPFSYNSLCYCSCCNHRRKEVHRIAPNRMYFAIGPQIHYTSKYYDRKRETDLKKQLGKTLLVFPFHKCEGEESGRGEENYLFSRVYEKYAMYFDSILVCAYWYDVNDKIFNLYEQNGAKVVSAGFRGDDNFIRRLKTIISLCDAVVIDEVATNLGFCYYMKKPIFLEQRECRINDNRMKKNTEKFVKAFYTENGIFEDKQILLQEKLYNHFWGGSCLRTKDEAAAILKCAREVLKRSNYSIKGNIVDKATLSYMGELESTDGDGIIYKILRESLT